MSYRRGTGAVRVDTAACLEFGWQRYQSIERSFVVRIREFKVLSAALDLIEAAYLLEHRWWSVVEIDAASGRETFAPRRLDESPASLAHRYALSMPGISTVVLGVKNRSELQECIEAEAKGALDPELMAQIDRVVAAQ